jgi:hypothetical protein
MCNVFGPLFNSSEVSFNTRENEDFFHAAEPQGTVTRSSKYVRTVSGLWD